MPPAPTTPLDHSKVPTGSKKRKRDEVDLSPPPTRSQRASKRLQQEPLSPNSYTDYKGSLDNSLYKSYLINNYSNA